MVGSSVSSSKRARSKKAGLASSLAHLAAVAGMAIAAPAGPVLGESVFPTVALGAGSVMLSTEGFVETFTALEPSP